METLGEENIHDGMNRKEILLIQRLLTKATHPSPLKAIFAEEELESAAMAVSQYLASAAAAKKVNLGSPVEPAPLATSHELKNDSSLIVSNEVARDKRSNSCSSATAGNSAANGSGEGAVTGQAVTSKDLRQSRRNRPRARPPSPPPPSATGWPCAI